MASRPPRLNQTDIEAITAAVSTVLNTALNTAHANLANQIGSLINERPRKDRHPDYRNYLRHNNRPHRHTSHSRSKSKSLEVSPGAIFKSVMESYLLQARQPPIPEKVPEKVEVLPEKFEEEIIPFVIETKQEIHTDHEEIVTDSESTIEGIEDEFIVEISEPSESVSKDV